MATKVKAPVGPPHPPLREQWSDGALTKCERSSVFPLEIRWGLSSRCTHLPKDPSHCPELLAVIAVSPIEHVFGLKRALEDVALTPARYQQLVFGNRVLRDELTLAEEGINSESLILLNSIAVSKEELLSDFPPAEFDVPLVRYLLYHNALPTARTNTGANVLHCAATKGCLEVCTFFLRDEKFTSANAIDTQGATALHRAAQCRQAEACCLLIREEGFGAVSAVDNQGATALHRAAEHGLFDVCKLLLEVAPGRFTGVNAKDHSGATALHHAAFRGHSDICHLLIQDANFHEVCATDRSGSTALHRAAGSGLLDVCHALVQDERFTEVAARNWQGATAQQMARSRGHNEVSAWLEQASRGVPA
mmetsp:Transcript_84514/g.161570  ORF Transcript_84514/g.161570 Transcript_84514/m.161570 type:complete len:364 (+) Transcript_84514:58-1149(+)